MLEMSSSCRPRDGDGLCTVQIEKVSDSKKVKEERAVIVSVQIMTEVDSCYETSKGGGS